MTEPRHVPPLRLEVQFEDLTKQRHAAHFGMWLFIASEILLFAALFALYLGYRIEYSTEFAAGVQHGVLWIGTLNTSLLITSSFFAAWALHALRQGRRGQTLASLAAVVLLGCGFLGLKSLEYYDHLSHGIAPGQFYAFSRLPEHGAQLFFTLYYFMTGLHALHVIVGLAVMLWLLSRVYRGRTTAEHDVELELGALYWHLVDLVWIFLWPLLYLIH